MKEDNNQLRIKPYIIRGNYEHAHTKARHLQQGHQAKDRQSQRVRFALNR